MVELPLLKPAALFLNIGLVGYEIAWSPYLKHPQSVINGIIQTSAILLTGTLLAFSITLTDSLIRKLFSPPKPKC